MNPVQAVPAPPVAAEHLLRRAELIKHAWAKGAVPDTHAAVTGEPDLLGDKSLVLDLAYEEYCQRQEAGEDLDPEEFCDRFSAYRTSLKHLLAAHQFLEGQGALLAPPLPKWPEPGRCLGDFTLLRELGRGAFARVFLATESSAGGRFVAVKLTHEGTAEAGTLGPLSHPNIVQVLSARPQPGPDGFAVVCMPYQGGATLNDLLDHAFPTPNASPPTRARVVMEAIRATVRPGDPILDSGPVSSVLEHGTYVAALRHLARQMAEGLAFLHRRKIYHRDLKPSNVLLSAAGRPLLLDFNLCAIEHYTAPRLGGTLPYMAPEQLRAVAPGATAVEPPDGRADLFALGVILYELLTGKHPFGPLPLNRPPAEMIGWLQQRHRLGFRPLREVNGQADRPLARLIQRCLTLDRANRPETAREVADELKRQETRAGRRRLLIGLGGGLLFGGAALAGVTSLAKPLPPLGKEPQLLFEEGRTAFNAGDYRDAEKHFAKAVEADDGSALYWFALGRARMKQSLEAPEKEAKTKANEALSAFKEAHQRDPQGACEACLAYCSARMSSHNSAILRCNEAVKARFRTAALMNNLGFSRLQIGIIPEAIQDLNDALDLNPGLRAARYNRALAFLQLREGTMQSWGPGFPGQALEDIRLAMLTNPVTAELAYHAGCIHARAAQDVQDLLTVGLPPNHLGDFAGTYALVRVLRDGNAAACAPAKLQDQALGYLRQAVALGRDAARFADDPVLKPVLGSHPDFQALLLAELGPEGPQRELRLVDPLADLFN
jgi:serine/threonine protein kinase